jgi:hypothetical protein
MTPSTQPERKKLRSFSLRHILWALPLYLLPLSGAGQENTAGTEATVAPAEITETVKPPKRSYLPILSFAQGIMNFNGDVGYNRFNQPFTARSGFQIEVQLQSASRLSLAAFLLSGRLLGDEKTIHRTANFKSSVVSEGIMVRYDFLSRKNEDQVLVPFLTAGVEYIYYRSKSDLKDAHGVTYQYWDDGTIRNIAQDDPNADQATLLYRDYSYETDLRDANLDGFGKYGTSTWGIPVGAGVRFNISNRLSMHFSSVLHITGTDFIDGVTADGRASRKGNTRDDKFIFSSVSLRFSLSNPKESESASQITALAYEDADGDGVVDLDDDSSGTPRNNPVTLNGKPYDLDDDGIPDYRDQELKSAPGAVVNENGVTITEEMIEEKFRKDSLAALPAVIEYLKGFDNLTKRNPQAENNWMKENSSSQHVPIPAIYKSLDVDKNEIISPKEISTAIDLYLSRQSPYNITQFFELIDFFFSQR